MPPKPNDIYNPVETVTPDTNAGNDYIGVRATPEAFGGQVGQSLERAGGAVQQTGDNAMALAAHIQGMVNETLATNADAALAKRVGDLKGQFFSKTGLEAAAGLPDYQANLEKARQDIRAGLPGGAARAYDQLSTRSIANSIADGSVHATGQIKAAQIDAGSSLQNDAVRALADPLVAANPTRVGEHLADIHWGAQMQLPDPGTPGSGLKQDPETGQVNFDESTPEGMAAKNQFNRNLQAMVGQGQVNRFDTLAKHDVFGAFDVYQRERSGLPRAAQVQLDASFAPKIFDAHRDNVTGMTLADAAESHQQMLFNPSSAGSNANNLGNVKTASGAAAGTQDFMAPSSPVDGVVLTANNLRTANYQGKTLAQIAQTWTGESPQKAADWAENVSKTSGIAKDAIPDLNDPTQLSAMMKGIAVAEKSPGDRARFTDDVITQGVQASLSGQKPATLTAQQAGKPYGANPDGSPLTQADYYKSHSQDVYLRGDAYAERLMPGNLQFKHAVHESLSNYMSTTIQNQQATYDQDNRFIQRAINGEFTKGQQPTTLDQLKAIKLLDGSSVGDVINRAEVHSPKYMEGARSQINEAANHTPGYFSGVNFNDPHSIQQATALAVASSAKTGTSVSDTMWNTKEAAKFSDQWSALPMNGDKGEGTVGKIDVLRNVRNSAGVYSANVFSAIKKTYPNAAYAAAIPDDRTAGEIIMGDQRITEDKNGDIPLKKVDEAMHEDGYDQTLLPQQYDQVKGAARSIFAARYSSGQEPSSDDIKGAVKSALGGMEKTTYASKPVLAPLGVTGSQMDKFLSHLDNNDIVAGMMNAQHTLTNGTGTAALELPRGKGGATFQVGQTPFSLQTVAPGMYMVMQPSGEPYPAPGMKGGKMMLQLTPEMITKEKPQPVLDSGAGGYSDMAM